MKTIAIEDILKNGLHFGHRVEKWNPKMKKYIYGKSNNIHILNVYKIQESLQNVMALLDQIKKDKKTILFVGTKFQASEKLKDLCEKIKQPYVAHKWVAGMLTNFDTIEKRIEKLKEIEDMEKTGQIKKYTKKEESKLLKLKEKLENNFGGIKNMKNQPHYLFVIDIKKEMTAVKEAKKMGVKVIGTVDTNANPDIVDFPIFANDDAIKSLDFLFNIIYSSLA